jgi:hypothetical protein
MKQDSFKINKLTGRICKRVTRSNERQHRADNKRMFSFLQTKDASITVTKSVKELADHSGREVYGTIFLPTLEH